MLDLDNCIIELLPGLDTRTINALHRGGIKFVKELKEVVENGNIKNIRGIGQYSISIIIQELYFETYFNKSEFLSNFSCIVCSVIKLQKYLTQFSISITDKNNNLEYSAIVQRSFEPNNFLEPWKGKYSYSVYWLDGKILPIVKDILISDIIEPALIEEYDVSTDMKLFI